MGLRLVWGQGQHRVCVCELLAEAEERTTALHGIIAGGSHVRIWLMD